MNWTPKIGLEVHIQLNTKSKMFSRSSALYKIKPNTNISLTDMAFPGTLPTLNKNSINMAIKIWTNNKGKNSTNINI